MLGLLASDRAAMRSTTRSCERLVEATRSLKVGPAEDPATQRFGRDRRRSRSTAFAKYIEIGRETGRESLGGGRRPAGRRRLLRRPAHLRRRAARRHDWRRKKSSARCWRVLRAADLDEAIRIANGTDYALTGGVFSRSPEHFERARRELLVGNLYLNRGITGALVGRQPFGGFKHVRHRHQGRRPRLPAAVRPAADDHREHAAPRLRPGNERVAGFWESSYVAWRS